MSTPRALALPPGVARHTVHTERAAFAALRADPAGTPHGSAVLVPGWTGSKEDFAEILRPLADRGYAALTYDQRGQHETPGGEGGYSIEELAGDLAAIAGDLPAPVHLVGHSFGGLVVQRAILEEPTAYASATLLCSGPGALPEERRAGLRLMADIIAGHGLAVMYAVKQAHDSSQPGYLPPPPEIAEFLQRRFLSNAPECLRQMTLHLVEAADVIDELAALDLPILVAHGETDDGWPPDIQDTMAKRLGATLVVIARAGHSPAVEAPRATVEVLTGFWSRASVS